MRTDQDMNNAGAATFVSSTTIKRVIDNYRQYIVLQIPKGELVSIYPDMDNTQIGNPASVSGISDADRESIMTHWLGTAANLITGSDMTTLDDLGRTLLTIPDAIAIAHFCASFPTQPRNPGSGGTEARQLAA
jgi:alpha-galactosidase